MSIVRANREIDTLDGFPTLSSDKANDMGEWPVLQSYALHWGMVVWLQSGNSTRSSRSATTSRLSARSKTSGVSWPRPTLTMRSGQEETTQKKLRKHEDEQQARREVENPDLPNPATDAAAAAEAVLGDGQPSA